MRNQTTYIPEIRKNKHLHIQEQSHLIPGLRGIKRYQTFCRRVTSVLKIISTLRHFLPQNQFLISCVESHQQLHGQYELYVCVFYIRISPQWLCPSCMQYLQPNVCVCVCVCVVVLYCRIGREVYVYVGLKATSQQEGTKPSKPSCTLITGNLNSQTLSHSLCS